MTFPLFLLPGLPDPFAKISVDGTGQVYSTETCKASLDPKWNTHYDLYLGSGDGITISIWNYRKVQKKQGSGFLGCVRIMSSTVQRLKDTGYQRLNLCKSSPDDPEPVKGQIIISLVSRDAQNNAGGVSATTPLAVVCPGGDVRGPNNNNNSGSDATVLETSSRSSHQTGNNAGGEISDNHSETIASNLGNLTLESSAGGVGNKGSGGSSGSSSNSGNNNAVMTNGGSSSSNSVSCSSNSSGSKLPDGWEERRTPTGQRYYVNHVTKFTQWERPTRPASAVAKENGIGVGKVASGKDHDQEQQGGNERRISQEQTTVVSPSRVQLSCQENG